MNAIGEERERNTEILGTGKTDCPVNRPGKEVPRTPHIAQPEEVHHGMSFSDYRKSKMKVLKEATEKTPYVAQTVKHLPIVRETRVRFLGREVPLEKEMATHSSILAWKIPWTEESSRL